MENGSMANQIHNTLNAVCPDCGGYGIIIDYVAACCGNFNKHFSCCNNPIAEEVQIQCSRCEATGYLKPDDNPLTIKP